MLLAEFSILTIAAIISRYIAIVCYLFIICELVDFFCNICQRSVSRSVQMSEPFKLAGELPASMAYALLANETEATLVDVRTAAEWSFVGVPDLSGIQKQCIFLEWQMYPSMQQNPVFAVRLCEQLETLNVSRSGALLFLCRSGVRSKSAAQAMLGLGFERSINILGGFEGPVDGSRHRGSTDGWKAAGLPWAQT